ncbi:GNAT family N-acetyltransferase [Clostridium sp. P21]|uniref:GNAT family N-acetyltransferase n=1 Tax=Clostridium muellerianum TaxID=2716538 RepID=A0A7Y0EJZ4_9CLOT|nr:GNAT family N-acetyltransferase [Clostridium muellerianum]NMM64864.1 GNAT family N-acetyltransferase [Clostridium muellerianum]
MINYKRCSEVPMNSVFNAFKIGFSDYMIKIDISKETFINRFFNTEGNSKERSFIAFDYNNPIGIILGGIKTYEGISTMRCGSFAIHPSYRGTGISLELFKMHREEAVKSGCKQLFLEVIKDNFRAIKFYENMGYEKIYNLNYFYTKSIKSLTKNNNVQFEIKKRDITDTKLIFKNLKDFHINWQSDIDYIQKLNDAYFYSAYKDYSLLGVLCIDLSGRIIFLWVNKHYRCKSIGKTLLTSAFSDLSLSKLSIGFPNNNLIQGFINHVGFIKNPISQYEMYLTL